MAKNPTSEEAIERARAIQDSKIDAVRVLAESNQNVTEARERAAEAEREYARVFSGALSAGWTHDELRKIGFSDTEKKSRPRRTRPGGQVTNEAAQDSTDA